MGQKTLYVKGVFLVIIRCVAVEGMLGEVIFVGQKRADAAKLQDALAAIQHGKLIHAHQLPSPKTGEMYHPDSVVNIHKKILKDAGLEHLRFHDLRHTFATLALQNGVDVKTVSSMLGHFDAGFTLRTYTHVTRQMQESAAEKMGNFMAQVM